ncbi:hypothetical protein K458DRAFT_490345 [Lentithecium fluviatile CBS 122367]|uniref:HAD-like protein n=1 Tax=Lentithecium fluviatile CBS 122367 TaxID=1168545 RepID=A0A6G1INF2_9PLEO|nr:hypothetical protein K458DRAFT_490345 [Lentithecium fluviatile CBS 122367]
MAQELPPVRTCIFDGTLRLLDWAELPLSLTNWKAKEKEGTHLFKNSQLLPGIEKLLNTLHTKTSPPVKLSLASSAGRELSALKTSHIPAIAFAFSDPAFHVFGDDPEMSDSRKKPEPDIFLIALKRLNEALAVSGERALEWRECLVFEDSIAGVEAARRAGMRVLWVPHPGLAEVCVGRGMDVLMGRTEEDGRVPDYGDAIEMDELVTKVADTGSLVSEDGMAEMRVSLDSFPYEWYGINTC